GSAADRVSVVEDEPARPCFFRGARHATHRLDRWVIGPGRRTRKARLRRLPEGIFGPCGKDAINPNSGRSSACGVFMAPATPPAAPSGEDFAKMLEESFTQGSPQEGNVVKGTVVAIEKDVAVIDVGAKTEGRVALREFTGPGRQADIKVGDTVEVYLERVENALGEAVL